jgi:hypothetical protein
MSTRQTSLATIVQLYDAIGLSKEESEYLVRKGYKSPIAVLTGYINDKLEKLEDENEFPKGCVQLLSRLALYIRWKQETEGNLQNLHADAAFFETFVPEMVTTTATRQQLLNAQMANMSLKNDVSVRLSDYPKFSGRQVDWSKFNERFKAVIGLAGLKELLNEQPAHKSRVKAEPDYSRKNNLLHAILLHCTSEGIALHLVKKYEDDADGYLAYKHLYNHYQGHGNKQ